MKYGKDIRDASGHTAKEITALSFVMVEQAPGAFRLRFVVNDDLIGDIRAQGALQSFLHDVDELYGEFRSRFDSGELPKPN